MTMNELDSTDAGRSAPYMPSTASAPALGDVFDAVDDTVATFGAVIRNEADAALYDFRSLIREQPIKSIAIASAVAYLIGRVSR